MRRIFFIVLWVFVSLFLAGIASILIAFGLDMVGLNSWSTFLMDRLLGLIIWAAPAIGLTLGILGRLPGTKEQKLIQVLTKGEPHWTVKWIQYFILRVGLFFLFALATFPVAVMAGWVIDNYDAHYESILIIPVLVYYFGLLWFSNKTAKYMTFENQRLFSATKSALVDLKIRLAFLPFVGHWFAPEETGDDKRGDS